VTQQETGRSGAVAGLAMVPVILRETVVALKGKHCPDCG